MCVCVKLTSRRDAISVFLWNNLACDHAIWIYQTWFYWVCSWAEMVNAKLLTPPSRSCRGIVYTEQPRMRLLISKDQKQLSALWWHLKCHQWAYRFRRTRNSYLHHDDIWSVINELIDFEGPETIICTMMTFEVSSMSLSISKDQKQLSVPWWHLKCHQWAYWFRRTRNNYLHYDDFEVSSMSLLISKDQTQLSALWWHLKCHQWAYRFQRTRNNYLHSDDI